MFSRADVRPWARTQYALQSANAAPTSLAHTSVELTSARRLTEDSNRSADCRSLN